MVTAGNMTFDLGRGNDHGIDWGISGLSYISWYLVRGRGGMSLFGWPEKFTQSIHICIRASLFCCKNKRRWIRRRMVLFLTHN